MTGPETKCGGAALVASLMTSAIGVTVLFGWEFKLEVCKSIVPGSVAMSPLTAITFILAGISLVLSLHASLDYRFKAWARLHAICVALIGLIKLAGYIGGVDIGIDQYLFASSLVGKGGVLIRLAPNTALSFVLLGTALTLVAAKNKRVRFWVQVLVLILACNSLLAVLGYAFSVGTFYRFRGFAPMTLITSITFLSTCVSFYLSQTDCGLFGIMAGESIAGSNLRRLLPAAILVPGCIGWATYLGEKAGYYEYGESISTIGNIAVFTGLICISSLSFYRVEVGRKKAEDALRLLNSAVLQSKESIIITMGNLDWPGPEIIFTNPAFTKMTGYSQEEVLGKSPRFLQGPLTDKKVLQRLRSQLEAGDVFEGETINYRKDQTPFDLEWQITPLKDADDKITHFVALQRDVTARRKIQDDVILNEHRYRSLVEATTAIVWDTPPSGKFEIEQPSWTAFTGQSYEELRGWGWLNAVHPDDQAETTRLWSQAVETRSTYQCEHRLRGANGLYYNMTVRAVPLLDAEGEIVQFVGIHTNITDQRRMEARYRRLADSNAQGVIFWSKDGKINGANDAFLKLVGYTREDLVAGLINWIKLTPPEHSKIDEMALKEIAEHGVSSLYEKEFIRKDGSRVPLLYGAASFEDNPEEGVCFFLDLTVRKKLETQLFQAQKMETVGKLASGIAHEFNSILTAIIGQSELLLHDLDVKSPMVKNATEIHEAALRAARLTRQILAYGSKQMLRPEILDLNAVLSNMEDTLEHLMGRTTDVLLVRAKDLKSVKVDAGQIEQVILNLALNARDAMPQGGKLTLETDNIFFPEGDSGHTSDLRSGDYILLAVTDTGMGMSPEVRSRVFEPFFSTKGAGEGVGLGLSTCYGIIKQSGGHITVYGEPGRGAVFKIYLPAVVLEPSTAHPRLDTPNLPGGTETILMAEDDPSLLEMSASLLRRLGYTVFTASDGIKALEWKHQKGTGFIDLLLTDVVMPHMSGKELSDRIQATYPHTKILFMSAYTENAIVHQGILNEGVVLLQKPFTPSTLAKKIREVLDQPGAEDKKQSDREV